MNNTKQPLKNVLDIAHKGLLEWEFSPENELYVFITKDSQTLELKFGERTPEEIYEQAWGTLQVDIESFREGETEPLQSTREFDTEIDELDSTDIREFILREIQERFDFTYELS